MRSEDISITSWQSGSESAVLTGQLLCYIDKVQKMRTKILRHYPSQRLRDAVSDVASTIRSFLHFSVPDEGPLTEYESWMPDFMQGLAKGIEKSKSVVADAIEGVSKDMTINANAMMDQSNAKQTNAIMNITSLLAQYLPYLAKSLNIEWDTGGVAAKLARDMDRELGILAEEGGFL